MERFRQPGADAAAPPMSPAAVHLDAPAASLMKRLIKLPSRASNSSTTWPATINRERPFCAETEHEGDGRTVPEAVGFLHQRVVSIDTRSLSESRVRRTGCSAQVIARLPCSCCARDVSTPATSKDIVFFRSPPGYPDVPCSQVTWRVQVKQVYPKKNTLRSIAPLVDAPTRLSEKRRFSSELFSIHALYLSGASGHLFSIILETTCGSATPTPHTQGAEGRTPLTPGARLLDAALRRNCRHLVGRIFSGAAARIDARSASDGLPARIVAAAIMACLAPITAAAARRTEGAVAVPDRLQQSRRL